MHSNPIGEANAGFFTFNRENKANNARIEGQHPRSLWVSEGFRPGRVLALCEKTRPTIPPGIQVEKKGPKNGSSLIVLNGVEA